METQRRRQQDEESKKPEDQEAVGSRRDKVLAKTGDPRSERGCEEAQTMSLGLPDRIERKISPEPNTGCWLWTGHVMAIGYGRIYYSRTEGRNFKILAHRLVYEALVGPIPEGLVLDHKCRVRSCVNPDHLEPVTLVENILRGEGSPAQNSRKEQCDKGHFFVETNTYITPSTGSRNCRTCANFRFAKMRLMRQQ